MLFFRIVEVKVSSPRYYVSSFLPCVVIIWILHFRCTHGFVTLCTRASLHSCLVVRVPKQAACRRTHTSVSTRTPSGTPRDHLRRCHLPRSLPALAPESG